MTFDYDVFTTRNFGFVSKEEQERLRAGGIFVAGVGGMGGACLASLVRAGVGRLAIADIDRFEVSNLNRQVFATLDTLGQEKAVASAAAATRINPEIQLEVLAASGQRNCPTSHGATPVIVNGCDDVAATIELYRAARKVGATVVDAYAAPLPSVTVVRPGAPRPEERLRYPTLGKPWNTLTKEETGAAFLKELEYVLTNSSAAFHIDLEVAAEVASGKRSRMSFAPMVITTGNLMAYEALQLLLGRKSRTDHRGWFLNPYKPKIERPLAGFIAWAKGMAVRRFMARMMVG